MNGKIYIPKLAVLELTYKCNHSCLFCSCPWEANIDGFPKYQKETELNVDEWKQAINILSGYGVKNVSISGGEVLLKDGLFDILEYIRKHTSLNANSEIVLISNGLLMNEDFITAFKKYNVHLSLSLPGLTTFEKHTGVNNANGVLYWLNKCKQKGISTTVNVTATKINYFELYETIANGLIAGADTLLLNRFLIGGRGIGYMDELSLTVDEINGMLDMAEDVLKKSNRIGSVGTEIPLCIIKKKKEHYKKLGIGSLCAAGKEFFVIDPSGYIRTCNHSPNKCGHIFDDNIITDVNYWNCFVERNYIPPKCIKCRDVNYCDCGCREVANIMYGSIKEEDNCLKCLQHER